MKVSVQWLKDYVKTSQPAAKIAEVLTLGGLEVENIEDNRELGDWIFEVEVTTNRPDWLSHIGVAREIAALEGLSLHLPRAKTRLTRGKTAPLAVSVQDRAGCPYYTACVIEDVEFGASPEFMQKRLRALGLRPINLLVDVTNYVLLEYGQPLHAFDYDLLAGRKIEVRRARSGEKMTVLNGQSLLLEKDDLVIADAEKAVALAGVMGGKDTEVSARTKNIVLESALFNPLQVRRTARRLGISSDSSYRFERGIDAQGIESASTRAAELICEYARKTGKVSTFYRAGKKPAKNKTILFPLSEIKVVLGVDLPPLKVTRYLKNLGLDVKKRGKAALAVTAPSFRADLSRPVDLVEEVARLHGYDRIAEKAPRFAGQAWKKNEILTLQEKVRDSMLSQGFNESVTFSLIPDAAFHALQVPLQAMTRIINPQNKELSLLRPTFFTSFLEVIKHNIYHGNGPELKFFEIARLFGEEKKGGLPQEELSLGFCLAGGKKAHWHDAARVFEAHDMIGVLENLAEIAGAENELRLEPVSNSFLEQAWIILFNGQPTGICGIAGARLREFYDVKVPVFLAELSLQKMLSVDKKTARFKPLPKFPSSPRDISMIVDETVTAGSLMELIRGRRPDWIKKVAMIDLFRGGNIPKGKKSIALSIEYRTDDHTLTGEEVAGAHAQVIELLQREAGAELR